MKIFLFIDQSLESGYLISEDKNKKVNFNDLTNIDDILFVLPNEVLTFVKHDADLKNIKNLHASIINSVNVIDFDERSELQVLGSSNSQNFFTIKKDDLNLFKERFKRAETKIKLTSDLLFFKEIFNTNISFKKSIFYKEGENFIKLTDQAFSLLEQRNLEIVPKSLDDLKLDHNRTITFHEFDLFNFKNIFGFSAIKKWIYAAITLIVLLNLIGLFNIMSNWNQIKKMDSTLAELYISIYPDEDVTSLDEQVAAKFNAPAQKTASITSKVTQLALNIASTAQIIELSFADEQDQYLFVKCIFKNLSDEQIFVENQQNNNLTLSVVDRLDTKDIVITQFKYEL
tara:strand:- start:673 stop:1701 length:1029 start_codon:yes stop_codon:yes gene_type:complete